MIRLIKQLFQPSNAAPSALLSEILQDFPDFAEHRSDDWRTVSLLRRWVYRRVRRALSRSCLLDGDNSFDYYNQDATAIFTAFKQEQGGVWCGGTAHALRLLYRQFGFVSYNVDMGVPASPEFPGLTHVATLVEITRQGKRVLSMQDAYFNVSYIDKLSRNPMDYFDILRELSHRRHEAIEISEQTDETRVQALIDPGASIAPQISWAVIKDDYPAERTSAGLLKQTIESTFDLFARRNPNLRPFNDLLSQRGYPLNMIYLLCFPFAVYGDQPQAAGILKKAQTLIAS